MSTGLFGAMFGGTMLDCLPLRPALAEGATFGMGAHSVGVAKANQIGREEGSIAGLVMALVERLDAPAAPPLAQVLR